VIIEKVAHIDVIIEKIVHIDVIIEKVVHIDVIIENVVGINLYQLSIACPVEYIVFIIVDLKEPCL
jgi:hypothetical protein